MRNKSILFACLLFIMVALIGLMPVAAQGSAVNAPEVTKDDQLLHENFNSSKAWEKYTSDSGVDFGVSGGVYTMHMPESTGKSFVWAVNATQHTDVIIEATFIQRTDNPKSEFGLMCRADAAGFGYYFIVTGSGEGYIAKGVEDKIADLTDRTASNAIVTGTDANTLRAICAGDYLALYVNDTLVAEANDTEFTGGLTGLAAASGGSADADIVVDDLDIYQAVVGQSNRPTPAPTELTPPTPAPTETTIDNGTAPQIDGVTVGKVLLNETFDNPGVFDEFDTTDKTTHMHVQDGAYVMSTTRQSSFQYGQNTTVHDNSVVTVEATLDDGPINNGYGIICRASADGHGNGYYFAISSDGYYAIERFDENVDKAIVLVDWDKSSAINQGKVTNTLTVACVDDYLAFYANGVLLADIHDSTYTEGATGFMVIEFDTGEVQVSFDNLTIYNAKSA